MRSLKDSRHEPIEAILLSSVRVLRNYLIDFNDQKISFGKPEYYADTLESYNNISVCAAALHINF
jgi:hypothetical protein